MATTTEREAPRAFEPGMEREMGTATAIPGWDLDTERRIDDGETLARQIGWFSVGLGIFELVAPEELARYLGMEEKAELFRLYGVRELAKGVGILSQRHPSPNWLWARVAGDFLDMATLATGLTSDNRHRERVMAAIFAVAGVTVLDVICAQQLGKARHQAAEPSDQQRQLGTSSTGPR